MPDTLPTINNEPAQGIQALLDTVYLWNPDVANELIEQVNELLEELGEFSDAGCIKPYNELTAPVRQYLPCYNGDNVYVASADIEELPEQFNPAQWTLIATKAPVLQAGAGIDINGNEISVEQQVLSDAAAGGTAVQPEDLGTAAYASTSDFATAAQGGKADTAVQPADLAAVATSGSYTDLSNKPAIDGVTLTSQTTKADIGLAGVYKYKGSVATYADLANIQNPDVGDVYNVEDTGDNYAWNGTEWDQLGGMFVPPVTSVNSKTGAVVLSAEDVGATPQYSTMPTASASNVGEIVQFVGEQPYTPASATISQTAGSGLSGLSVDADVFATKESQSGSYVFTAFEIPESLTPTVFENIGGATFSIDTETFMAKFREWAPSVDMDRLVLVSLGITGPDNCEFGGYDSYGNYLGGAGGITLADMQSELGVTITGTFVYTDPEAMDMNYTPAGVFWGKDNVQVNLTDYGITYTGTPVVNDELTVVFSAEELEKVNGYFYKNVPTYTDPTATISQTVGTGLTDLSVDVEQFRTQETESGSYTFVAYVNYAFVDPTTFEVDNAEVAIDSDTFLAWCKTNVLSGSWEEQNVNIIGVEYHGDTLEWKIYAIDVDNNYLGDATAPLADMGIMGLSLTSGELPTEGEWWADISYYPTEVVWSNGDTGVNLEDYGISYSGVPNTDDALTVVFTASTISGYSWEQIDVQPSSGGGQTIEYDDIDFVYGTDPSGFCLYFELENLTTGDYYFYVKSAKLSSSQGGNVVGFQTHKVSFHWDSTWNGGDPWVVARAFIVSPVLEGDFVGSQYANSNAFQTQNESPLECYFNDNTENKFGIKMLNWLQADTDYIYRSEPAVYKVSKLYGGENPITLTLTKIGKYGSIPNYSSAAGCGNTTPLVKDAVLPDKKNIQSYNVGSLSFEDSIALLSNLALENSNTNTTQVHFSCACKYGDFVGDVVYNIDGRTTQQITKATGPFVNSRFYIKKSTGEIYVSFDSAAFAALQDDDDIVYMSAGIYGTVGATEVTIIVFAESQATDIVATATRIPFVSGGVSYVFDTPTLEEYKNIIQYIGETDANYTNGYFYKADGTVVTVPASITCTENSATGTTITCTGSDAENLIAAIRMQTGWDDATLFYYLNDQYNIWTYDADNNVFSWGALGSVPTEWIQYFTFSPAVTTGTISWNTSNATNTHDELQNGVWLQKDVQPNPDETHNKISHTFMYDEDNPISIANIRLKEGETAKLKIRAYEAFDNGEGEITTGSELFNIDVFLDDARNLLYGNSGNSRFLFSKLGNVGYLSCDISGTYDGYYQLWTQCYGEYEPDEKKYSIFEIEYSDGVDSFEFSAEGGGYIEVATGYTGLNPTGCRQEFPDFFEDYAPGGIMPVIESGGTMTWVKYPFSDIYTGWDNQILVTENGGFAPKWASQIYDMTIPEDQPQRYLDPVAIFQYLGETDQDYTQGYFYKIAAVGQRNATVISTSGSALGNITIDQDKFADFLKSQGIYWNSISDYIRMVGQPYNVYWDFRGTSYTKADLEDVIGISYDGYASNGSYIEIGWDDATFEWQQVNTQPEPVVPDPLPSQTGNAGKLLTTDGTDASWDSKTNLGLSGVTFRTWGANE